MPLEKDVDGAAFDKSWYYPNIVGILMYLATDSRPDFVYAAHQFSQFTHNPRESHDVGVKHILRYLKGIRDRGMDIHPTGK